MFKNSQKCEFEVFFMRKNNSVSPVSIFWGVWGERVTLMLSSNTGKVQAFCNTLFQFILLLELEVFPAQICEKVHMFVFSFKASWRVIWFSVIIIVHNTLTFMG